MEKLSQVEVEQCQQAMDDALVYKAKGEYEAALNKFSEIFQAGIFQADILYQLADTYFMQEDYDRAIVWGKKTIELDDKFLQAYWLIALAHYKLNDIKRMLLALEKGLSKGFIGEYHDIFSNIFADKEILAKYKSFILIKCPLVKAKLLTPNNKTAKTNNVSDVTVAKLESDSKSMPIDNSKISGLISNLQIMVQPADTKAEKLIDSIWKRSHATMQDANVLKNMDEISILVQLRKYDKAADKIKLLNMLAVALFSVQVYDKSLALLMEAEKIGESILTAKNLAAVLCQIGEVKLAEYYLKQIGGQDIMALNLLAQIKISAASEKK